MLEKLQEVIDFFIDKRLNDISLDLGEKDGKYKNLEIALLEVQDKLISKADKEL